MEEHKYFAKGISLWQFVVSNNLIAVVQPTTYSGHLNKAFCLLSTAFAVSDEYV